MSSRLTRNVAVASRLASMTDKKDDADTPDPIEEADEQVAEGHPTETDPLVEK